MTVSALFVENIQGKLPCAKLFLQKKPGPLCDWHSCALTAVSLGDPSKSFSMTFDEGMGEGLPDDAVTSFVDSALRVLNG